MPMWSAGVDACECRYCCVMRTKYFFLFGGVPRYVLQRVQKGGTIVTEFSQLNFGFVDSQDCYLLVHIDPPMSDDGEYEDCPFVWL